MSAKIKDVDQGYQKTLHIFRNLGLSLSLGVMGEAGARPHRDPNGKAGALTVGEVAAIHELGLGVPERSWLRAWFEANHKMVIADVKAGMVQIAQGRLTPEALLDLLGQKYVGEIRKRIQAGIDPPLAQETIDRKKSSTPLIDTGQLWSAITYEVRRLASNADIQAFKAAFAKR